MTDHLGKPGKSYPLGKVLLFVVTLDALWATLVATLNATVLHEAGSAVGASDGGNTLATVLTWVITWVIAFLQGGIFLIVFGVFAIVGIAFLSKLRSSNNPQSTSGNTASDE